MQWPVDASNDPDLEKLSANYPNIRFITVPKLEPKSLKMTLKANGKLVIPKLQVSSLQSVTSLVASYTRP